MMEREKRERGRNSGLKFFSALGRVQEGERAHTASKPASRRKSDKRFWVVISFFWAGKARAWGFSALVQQWRGKAADWLDDVRDSTKPEVLLELW